MSTNIVILTESLSKWLESHISAMYNATSDTSKALNNLLSKDAVLIVNGKKTSCNDLTRELQSEKFFEAGATVTFLHILEVPANKTAPVEVIISFYFHLNV